MRDQTHEADLCVVGGGLAGLCAALAAARHGARVVLMHDRPVLGGNASSEIRMWIGGAHGPNMRETGLIEEILLENRHRNPDLNYSVWDSVLYGMARFQPNLTLLLNCTCTELAMDGQRIRSVRGWQLTTETWHTVRAPLFADCSGDSVLAPLSGADFRIGREARTEFGETAGQDVADLKTMGLSCLLQARETDHARPFTPPEWAHRYARCEDLPHRHHVIGQQNFWWIELGGDRDSIHDAETVRDELLKVAFGVWDHIKNRCPAQDAARWSLDWLGFLPGKRESRRYLGDHILTQTDVQAGGRFEDIVAYGGWTMDDHPPAGFHHPGPPTRHHRAPSPYGIPYRCLYSRNVANLFCAGRNIGATHMAISSTRVMATCALLGQAVGTAAALAAARGCGPRGVYEAHLADLQQALMDDDCYLPWHRRAIPDLTRAATLVATAGGDPEPLRNGVDRTVGREANLWEGPIGAVIEYRFAAPATVRRARIVLDSDLSRPNTSNMACCYPLDAAPLATPPQLLREFRIETTEDGAQWTPVPCPTPNRQRLVNVAVNRPVLAVRFVPLATHGAPTARVFAFDVR